ncbi:ribonuclease E inhibitor RraB [uncultured Pseudoteredinibacter sp.]|uniref:ribonuclease E inhibitor RraB n=1 Tax=uncultured Pseudoteredinibacter sp. TaxID=1641701 RepID=UPI00260E073F|nr:ribonuclease E inhibitor RraB [uncultured Pseudoteredinibacter sp.]
MKRDYSKFPNDACGDSLWRMVVEGDDLTEERDLEFIVIFETEDEAMKFGEHLLFNRQKVLLCDDDSEDYPYFIASTVSMIPRYETILEYERLLEKYASPLNGKNDGWSCYVCK